MSITSLGYSLYTTYNPAVPLKELFTDYFTLVVVVNDLGTEPKSPIPFGNKDGTLGNLPGGTDVIV